MLCVINPGIYFFNWYNKEATLIYLCLLFKLNV